MQTSLREMLYSIADAVQLTLSYGPDYRVRSDPKTITVSGVTFAPMVIDSFYNMEEGVSGVMLKVIGDLYLMVIYEADTKQLIAAALDQGKYNRQLGSKKGWTFIDTDTTDSLLLELQKVCVGMWMREKHQQKWFELVYEL